MKVFSPLRDECLPADTDIVYLGCGSPHEHAAALAENHCMLMALKEHVCSGKRIYAEGGGLAYLCQHVEMADGKRTPMVGALRAVAKRNPCAQWRRRRWKSRWRVKVGWGRRGRSCVDIATVIGCWSRRDALPD